MVSEQFPGEFAIPEKGFLRTPLAVAALKNKKSGMLNGINVGLRKLKEESTYDQILKKWIGPEEISPET